MLTNHILLLPSPNHFPGKFQKPQQSLKFSKSPSVIQVIKEIKANLMRTEETITLKLENLRLSKEIWVLLGEGNGLPKSNPLPLSRPP